MCTVHPFLPVASRVNISPRTSISPAQGPRGGERGRGKGEGNGLSWVSLLSVRPATSPSQGERDERDERGERSERGERPLSPVSTYIIHPCTNHYCSILGLVRSRSNGIEYIVE